MRGKVSTKPVVLGYCPKCEKNDQPMAYRGDGTICKSWCRSCAAKYTAEWNRRNPVRSLLAGTKARAKKRGIEFSITDEDIHLPEFCPVLGLRLTRLLGGSGQRDSSPTIDRLDPNKGYVKGNCFIISWRANRLKSNGTADEHEKIAAYMRRS